jgi:3-hydroxymyristoyl/3-hydroxydecanoyl-(acyl carrier protein) dehydratase
MKHNLAQKIISRSEADAVIDITIPSSCDYFDGHFPVFQLLPAVGQFDIAVHASSEIFGTSSFVTAARRMKFTRAVRPDSTVRLSLSLNKDKKMITYSFAVPDGSFVYSTGTFAVSEESA